MDESTVTLLRFVKSYIEASGWIFDTVSVFWNLMYPWNCMFVGYWLSPAFWQSCAWKPLDFFRFLKTIYKMNLMFYSVWPEIRYGAHKLIRPLLTEVRAEGCFHSGKFYWKSWCDPCFDCVGFSFFFFFKSSLLFQQNLFLLHGYNKMNVRFHMTSSVIFKCRVYIFLVSAEVWKNLFCTCITQFRFLVQMSGKSLHSYHKVVRLKQLFGKKVLPTLALD